MVDDVSVGEAGIRLDGGQRPVAPEADEGLQKEEQVQLLRRGRSGGQVPGGGRSGCCCVVVLVTGTAGIFVQKIFYFVSIYSGAKKGGYFGNWEPVENVPKKWRYLVEYPRRLH